MASVDGRRRDLDGAVDMDLAVVGTVSRDNRLAFVASQISAVGPMMHLV